MSADTYAIPCPKCGYPTPVDGECRKCGAVARDEPRPLANKAPYPYTIIDRLTSENTRLLKELEDAKETMIRHSSMLLCDNHAHVWGEFNDCPVCRAEAAEQKLAVYEGALKDIIRHQELMAGPWLSKHSVVIFLAQRALDKIKGVEHDRQ